MNETLNKTGQQSFVKNCFAQRRKAGSRLVFISICILFCAAGLIFFALRDTISFFRSPSEITEADRMSRSLLRLGGYVEKGSVKRDTDTGIGVRFRVTDFHGREEVCFNGILPDLFREGQGVIVEGRFHISGCFRATRVLARHDERYVPKGIADKLKAQGLWEDYTGYDR